MNWRVKPYDLTAAYCALAGRMIEQQLRMAKVVMDHTWRSHLAFAGLAPATRPRTVTPPRRNELVGKALAGDPLLQQVLPQQDELSPMGLLGPVRLGRLAPAPTPPLSTDSE